MIVDSYLVNQTPTQSHNSHNNPLNTAVDFENPLVLADEFEKLDALSIPLERVSWWISAGIVGGILLTGFRQGPLERRFGLATLVVNTGGTHEPSISLSGLTLARAEELREQLSCSGIKLPSNDAIRVEPLP